VDTLDLRGERGQQDETALTARRKTFSVTYNAPDGQTHTDVLVSQIMNADERIRCSQRCAAVAGVPWAHLPTTEQARIIALMTVAFQIQAPPKWFERWMMEDDQLLFAVFRGCQAHTDAYFLGDNGEGTEGPIKPRVVIEESGAS
jgi:hypothetical protein